MIELLREYLPAILIAVVGWKGFALVGRLVPEGAVGGRYGAAVSVVSPALAHRVRPSPAHAARPRDLSAADRRRPEIGDGRLPS